METFQKSAYAIPDSKQAIIRPLFRDPVLQQQFDQNGYVIVDLLTTNQVEKLKKIYHSLKGDLGMPAFASTIMSGDAQYRKAVSSVIEETLGPPLQNILTDSRIFWGNFNIKYPNGRNGTVPLHQDPSFLDERLFCPLGIWAPLNNITALNGALHVIPGSHLLLKQPRCGGRPFPFAREVQTELMERYGRQLIIPAGHAYIGSPALFHYSLPNSSSEPRIVAAGLAGGGESTLKYFHFNQQNGTGFAEMFDVDKDYYLSAPLFSRPSAHYPVSEVIPIDDYPDAQDILGALEIHTKLTSDAGN